MRGAASLIGGFVVVGLALLFVVVLAGCAVNLPGSTPPAPAPDLAAPAPKASPAPCVAYTPAQQASLANALQELDVANIPGRQVIEGFLTDYHNTRATLHCAGAQ